MPRATRITPVHTLCGDGRTTTPTTPVPASEQMKKFDRLPGSFLSATVLLPYPSRVSMLKKFERAAQTCRCGGGVPWSSHPSPGLSVFFVLSFAFLSFFSLARTTWHHLWSRGAAGPRRGLGAGPHRVPTAILRYRLRHKNVTVAELGRGDDVDQHFSKEQIDDTLV